MSSFDVKVRVLDDVIPHPNADKLELGVIGGYRAVLKKNQFQAGQPVVYIPTDAVIPDEVSVPLGIKDYLVGKQENRVKPIRLRGELSEGIVLPLNVVRDFIAGTSDEDFGVGDDLTERLGITKYEPEIPVHMEGRIRPWPSYLDKYDVENVNRPEMLTVISNGEMVVATEKLHGTNVAISLVKDEDGTMTEHVCSRNQSIEMDSTNLYWSVVLQNKLIPALELLWEDLEAEEITIDRESDDTRIGGELSSTSLTWAQMHEITLRGEIVGVQDLKYGVNEPTFYAFDIRINGTYVDYTQFVHLCERAGIAMVPKVYEGPYSYDMMKTLSTGMSKLANHMREGIVVKPIGPVRYEYGAGRVQVKFINEDYLIRKGGTEYH